MIPDQFDPRYRSDEIMSQRDRVEEMREQQRQATAQHRDVKAARQAEREQRGGSLWRRMLRRLGWTN